MKESDGGLFASLCAALEGKETAPQVDQKDGRLGWCRFATKFPNYPIIIGHHYRLARNYRRGSELLPVKRESGPRNSCAQPIGCSKVKGEEKPPSALACSSERGGQERSLWEQPDSFMM